MSTEQTNETLGGSINESTVLRVLFDKSLAQLTNEELKLIGDLDESVQLSLSNLGTWIMQTGCMINEDGRPSASTMTDILFSINTSLDNFYNVLHIAGWARHHLDQRRKAGAA